MNTKKHEFENQKPSVFICVNRWLMSRTPILALLALLAAPLFSAQDPVQWTLVFDSKSAAPGSKILGRLTAKIEPTWHLYSLTTPRPPIATTVGLADNPAGLSARPTVVAMG